MTCQLKMEIEGGRMVFPEIVSKSGMEDVAEVFVARTRPGDDKSLVEFVDGTDGRMPREEKWIINISTQFGCPLGCRFCDAGREYHGNVSAEEMLGQAAFVLSQRPGLAKRCKKLKVHFARMGEPALNDETLVALEMLPGLVDSPGLWACVPTAAPAGRMKWYEKLFEAKERLFKGRFQLQFSINTTDKSLRRELMPFNLNEIEWMAEYSAYFHRPGDRKVVLNFALAQDVSFEPVEIVRRFDPQKCAVKLTPLNPTYTGYEKGLCTHKVAVGDTELERKTNLLRQSGFDVVLSVGDGREDEIGSNCGQSVRTLRERDSFLA